VASARDGAIAHPAASMAHSHHPAGRKARRPNNPELHMRKGKVRVSSEAFDTECHGFTFPREMASRVARAGSSGCA
jgi:hypothetical protein